MKFNLESLRSKGYYVKEITGFLFLLFAIYFFRHQSHELQQLSASLKSARGFYLLMGLLVTIAYGFSHALMYKLSFRTIGADIALIDGLTLYLKRNFVSIFLPGGGVTSLAFFSQGLEQKGLSRTRISLASYMYGLVGLLTVFLITIPAMIVLLLDHKDFGGDTLAFGLLSLLILLLAAGTYSIFKKGWLYRKILLFRPDTELILAEISASDFSKTALVKNICTSLFIELLGILHLLIAMWALGGRGAFEAAFIGYVIATLFLVISPFLKGLGAVELSLILVLKNYGLDTLEATSITFLYRFFEFWLPMIWGAAAFIWNRGNLLLRLLPAVLLFILGLIDIISVLTPAIGERLELISRFLPIEALRLSNGLVLLIGLLQLVTAAFLLKGMRSAWAIAATLCLLSVAGNLLKGLDYEEALFALITLGILLRTKKDYYVRTRKSAWQFSLGIAMSIFFAVSIYGIAGFYFLDQRHFGIDFSLSNALLSTYDNFILLNAGGLVPRSHFGVLFLYSIRVLGAGSILLVFYGLIRPYFFKTGTSEADFELAKAIIQRSGNSSIDYFKTYADKQLFFNENRTVFIAFKTANDYAIALEGPTGAENDQQKLEMLLEFEDFCTQNGLKAAYYRITPDALSVYERLGKKNLIIGQEAIVDIGNFSLEGGARKSLRNAVNSVAKKGYILKIYMPPVNKGLIQKLAHVSSNWLTEMEREEMVFSQGIFDAAELGSQVIITLEDDQEQVVAFLNIIPDYAAGELTYDLIRKSSVAPSGNMDALIVELIRYGQLNGYKWLNMGMAPMSGIEKGRDLPERAVKFAYEKLKGFRHYHGLRDFKDKFDPVWDDRYLVYSHHYDLIRLPAALNQVMKAE